MTSVTSAEVLFRLQGHSVSHGRHRVLHDINLSIYAGEKVALIGPSGAGKSTLLDCLYPQQAAYTALCPQQGGLVDILSVYQNIYMGGLERHHALYNLWNLLRPRPADKAQVSELTRLLGIDDKLWHSVDKLSGGQRQRVAIGRALFRQQPIFFGDEPVSALDPTQAEAVLKMLIDRHQTLIVTLHNRRLALTHFNRVIALRDGFIHYDGAAADLSEQQLDALYAQ
ncbi:ATP-binding cassette domain-containing protein [Thalassolituus marinus]|uniref:ATP-binding cassette domain-containing protein n=1 Tax=Thalassolituus marinus TaxID=671053 RepID=A0ABS7ZK95_9GAMM|nr:ATP-binding cassette domain-containing protein [Thalassolituus marinus]MCA6062136.1 ATP-binding cassette domain-containing protein [Thalassolituus marinus]